MEGNWLYHSSNYSSFCPPPFSAAVKAIGFPFVRASVFVPSAYAATTASLIIPTTLAQAIAQICMLTLPRGALGNARIHSMYPGSQPFGIQNSA